MKSVSLVVANDGEVIANNAVVLAHGKRVVAIAVDMKTKRGKVEAVCCGGEGNAPGVVLSGKNALHINPAKKGEPTMIEFPDFPGWTVHSTDYSRYTLNVCLVKGIVL